MTSLIASVYFGGLEEPASGRVFRIAEGLPDSSLTAYTFSMGLKEPKDSGQAIGHNDHVSVCQKRKCHFPNYDRKSLPGSFLLQLSANL